jgi:O-antigen ligase
MPLVLEQRLSRVITDRGTVWWGWALGSLLLAGALVLLPLPIIAALLVGLPFVVLVLRDPVFGLYGAILSVPIQELVGLPAGLTVTQAVVALATGAWLLRVLAYPDRSLNLRYQWPWLLFLSWQLLAVIATPYDLALSVQQWARWVAAWLAFVLTVGTITDRRRAWGLLVVLLAAPSIAALHGILQFVTASGPPSYLILGGRFARAAATFVKPNPFAGYLNMAWPVAAALAVYFMGVRLRGGGRASLIVAVLAAGTSGLLLAGLFASYSRGGWIGAVLGVMTLAVLGGRRTAAAAGGIVVCGLLVGLLGVFSALPPVIVERLGAITNNVRIFDAGKELVTPENFAVVERMAHWQAAWRMWEANPLLGIGPGNYNSAYPSFFVGRWSISQGHAHNYYLHILAEAGPGGLALYLLLIGVIFRQGLRLRRLGQGTIWGAIGLGGCGIMLAVAGHNVFENLHVLNLGIQLSGVWGLMVVAERFILRQTDERSTTQ